MNITILNDILNFDKSDYSLRKPKIFNIFSVKYLTVADNSYKIFIFFPSILSPKHLNYHFFYFIKLYNRSK